MVTQVDSYGNGIRKVEMESKDLRCTDAEETRPGPTKCIKLVINFILVSKVVFFKTIQKLKVMNVRALGKTLLTSVPESQVNGNA